MTVLAVAGVSARLMAEAAARDGFEVIALDLFGDADTRRAASHWGPIGAPGSMRIAAAPVLAALAALSRRGDVAGWVAGAGFEGEPDLLDAGAALLPLIGTAPDAVRRVRDPATFFGVLDARRIDHPAVRLPARTDAPCASHASDASDATEGWLVKNARGCGGWHIRRASARGDQALLPHHYLQREISGVPMSATFVADGRDAVVLGCNQLIVRAVGDRPHVYCGAIGPVPVTDEVAERIDRIVGAMAEVFALKGLCSLDFLLDGSAIGVLEVNPRPPASMALYPGHALMTAHWRACTAGRLPASAPATAPATASASAPASAPPPARVNGIETVFATRRLHLDEAAARHLAGSPHAHDLPGAGARFEAGDPVCSWSASGADVADVQMRLRDGREALSTTLETCS